MEVVLYVLCLSPIPQLQHDKLCSILANKSQDKTYFGMSVVVWLCLAKKLVDLQIVTATYAACYWSGRGDL